MASKKLTSANPIIFETQSYNLSDLSYFQFHLILLVNCKFFPRNELVISYSKECGVWKELATITAENLAAGYFSQDFIPNVT